MRRALAVAGALAALVPALVMWGFTVDDALIPIRYAENLASGAGYRFDAQSPASDGVTPLPWSFLLVPLSNPDALVVLFRAKVLGVVVWTLAAAALGARLAKGRASAAVALVALALAFEIGAWSASGLETGVVTALATAAAVTLDRPRVAALLAGAVAAFRPELLPWAGTIAVGASLDGSNAVAAARKVSPVVAIAVAPFAACVVARMIAFGRPTPLAVLAKPSDLDHGLTYAGAAFVVLLLPILACAPRAIARSRGTGAPTLAIAFCVHLASIAAAGGDWMPYARLLVPVAPSLAIVFVESAAHAHRASIVARSILAVGLGIVLLRAAPAGRHVTADRTALVVAARPALADAQVVAALDVGWVSAATDARIVDLAGLTDPAIAILPGGHTSKRVDAAMLLDRGVDTVVIYGQPRVVEQRLLRSELFADRFEKTTTLPLGYAIYRRR